MAILFNCFDEQGFTFMNLFGRWIYVIKKIVTKRNHCINITCARYPTQYFHSCLDIGCGMITV